MIDTVLDLGVVKHEMLEPMKRWRLTASGTSWQGEAATDVTFNALTPPIGGDGQNQEAADSSSAQTRLSVGKGHLEQGGRWTGWIEAGGQRKELGDNARGNRDKSWGPRLRPPGARRRPGHPHAGRQGQRPGPHDAVRDRRRLRCRDADDEVKVVILAADGEHFSSGHDLVDTMPVAEAGGPVTGAGGFTEPGPHGHFATEQEIYLGLCWRPSWP